MDYLIGWPGGDWQATARLAGTLAGGYIALIWLASVLWVYRDISSRTRDPVSQTVSVAIAVVMPLIGLPIYFALRPNETLQEAHDREIEQEAMLSEMHSLTSCPNCRRPVEGDFMVCAYCATELKQPCASCGQPLRAAYRYCPHCATPKPVPEAERFASRLDFSVGDEEDELEPVLERAPEREAPAPTALNDAIERRTPVAVEANRRAAEEQNEPRDARPAPSPFARRSPSGSRSSRRQPRGEDD
ncbi:MAG: zinc ribbon domain-containing protein [Dehalococcoidia bacterium]